MPGFSVLPLSLALLTSVAAAQSATCSLSGYKAVPGIQAEVHGGAITLQWPGEAGQQLRAAFGIRNGQPVVEQLAVRRSGGAWIVLGSDLTPDFHVTTGRRRPSATQVRGLKHLGMDTPEEEEKDQWNAFWDAPLVAPGNPARSAHLPRSADEVRRAAVTYQTSSCGLESNGDRVSVRFNGLTLGVFSGSLQFTVYRGSNLLRQEAIASTRQPSVAFIYQAGLREFQLRDTSRVTWRDTSRGWQQYDFGGATNTNPVGIRARDNLLLLSSGAGSLGVFPPPHKFFFAREDEVNLGYVYYRKDSSGSFSIGVMQPEIAESFAPWGVSDAEWNRRVAIARDQGRNNFALYNAPPGTEQHMAVYYYLSPESDHAAQQAVLAYTHNDVFKPVPGFKVLTGHFHLDFNEMLRDRNDMDFRPEWVSVFRGLGINVVYLGDFHDDSDPHDPGPKRFMEQKIYFEGTQKVSDRDFLVMPEEEVNSFLGGHWYLMTPRPFYFSHAEPRPADQPFMENDPTYGPVYHLGSSQDVLTMLEREHAIIWTAHPRTKSSQGYPDQYKGKDFFLNPHFIGASWESLPVDLSEKRLCPHRCFDTEDDMSNWSHRPRYMIAEGDTYTKALADDTYNQLAVNYVRLDRVPSYQESWAPIVDSLQQGHFFGTTGEILFHNWGVQGSGPQRTYTAAIEYTFPLEFAELVWGDGHSVGRRIIKLTDTAPFGTRSFRIPFDASGKEWVRFAVWDSAGDGAWAQPIALQ